MALRDRFLDVRSKRIPSRLKGEGGSVVITVGLSLIAILLIVGIAVDMGRAYLLKQGMQTQIDAAGLAVAARNTANTRLMQTTADNNIRDNKALVIQASFDPVYVSFDPATFSVTLTLTGRMNTSFMAIGGISQIPITVTSTSLRPRRLDVAVIVDTSSSMRQRMGSGKTRFDNLKDAASALLDILIPKDTVVDAADPRIRIGFVPFTTILNIGTQWKDSAPDWLTIPADATRRTNCRLTGHVSCEDVSTTCDGVRCTRRRCTGEQICDERKATWLGCVGMRSAINRDVLTGWETDRYPGVIPAKDELCGPQIQLLSGVRADLAATISALAPIPAPLITQTYIPSGLTWAWNMLTPEEPLKDPRAALVNMSTQGQRAIVLMTDGLNTADAASDANNADFVPFDDGNPPATNALTRDLCANIRQSGIMIFTVVLQVRDSRMTRLMANCSQVAGRSFNVETRADLITAFQTIARQLQGVRITK